MIAQLIIECAAGLTAAGGLYDLCVPRLPFRLLAMCGGDERACRLVRELLRALGGALFAIGIGVAMLAASPQGMESRRILLLVLALVVPSEGVNSVCMYRVRSLFYVPLVFLFLALLGVMLAWPSARW